jgi:hypothetical protein
MKASDFTNAAFEIFPIQYGRLQKQMVGLRKKGLYPDGREAGEKAHVAATQAAHLVRVASLNLNPFSEEFDKEIDDYKKLISGEGDYFVLDLAEILINGGLFLPSKKDTYVHHISFSLDRPRVVIVFETSPDSESEQAPKIYQSEKIYGEGEILRTERWCIIKRSALVDLSLQLTDAGQGDFEEWKTISEHITTLK